MFVLWMFEYLRKCMELYDSYGFYELYNIDVFFYELYDMNDLAPAAV